MAEVISKDLIRGHTDTIILNILHQGDSYGYQVAKRVRELSGGHYDLNEATLYTVFRRLGKNGAVTNYWGDETQGSRRKYYHITARGEEILQANTAAWRVAKPIIDQLITGQISQED
ncbi:PadR family transcriptional regulator [Levilactobacillus namurensis]|uniref:PadR family transcriptional regulator n=1 Tax=Levilactobacillus namurensis TaxID=380393 RepID=A0AAW8W310_9LACO|nr:PadR family transcriptional regulator [Levilactobacillus namurensis]MDT7013102.1 PadR family transcriptional regulator [Levilactobacillus namurensis]